MANINVRGLSDATKEALRVRAAQAGMSLEAFARRALQQALLDDGREPQHLLQIARKYFGKAQGVELAHSSRATRRLPVDFSHWWSPGADGEFRTEEEAAALPPWQLTLPR